MTEITLLTQADCMFCEQAKQVLSEVGADHEFTVTEIGLDTDRGRELALSAGVMFAPGVLIDGKPFSYGRLSTRKLRKALSAITGS